MKITFLMLIATIIAITLSAQTVTRNVTTAGLTSGRVPYTTSGGAITDAATLTYNGTSLMSTRSGNDYELLQVQNTGNGASAMAGLFFYNDNGQIGSIRAHGSGTGAGIGFANAVNLYGTTTAGINLIASTGPVNIYAGGTSAGNRRVQVSSSGMTVGGGTALAYAAHGTGTFTAGTVTISNTNVTANSRILVTRTSSGTGVPYVSAKTASTSFTVTSSDGADTGTFDYWIVN